MSADKASTEQLLSYDRLRQTHLELVGGDKGSQQIGHIRDFVVQLQEAGASIECPAERQEAQRILDFWAPELALSSMKLEWIPFRLKPYEGRVSTDSYAEQPDKVLKDAREQVRLAALARQWRAANRSRGYLLSGAALKDSARFRDRDSEIAEFVAASEAVALRWKYVAITTLATIVALIAIIVAATLYAQFRQAQAKAAQLQAESDLAYAKRLERLTDRSSQQSQKLERQLHTAQKPLLAIKEGINDETITPGALPASVVDAIDKVAASIGKSNNPQTPSFDSTHLAGLVELLDARTPAIRRSTTQQFVAALRKEGREADKLILVNSLLTMALNEFTKTLTHTGQFNLLSVLCQVPAEDWSDPSWIDAKARLRRFIAGIDTEQAAGNPQIGHGEARFFNVLKSRADFGQSFGATVYLQFSALSREKAADISAKLEMLGWQLPGIEENTHAINQNEVRYGPATDEPLAALLAADLRALGQTNVRRLRHYSRIHARTPEIWISE